MQEKSVEEPIFLVERLMRFAEMDRMLLSRDFSM